MYADCVTKSMEYALSETLRRRSIQMKYNEENGITPTTIVKDVRSILEISSKEDTSDRKSFKKLTKPERDVIITKLEKEMRAASKLLEFEQAAYLRDKIKELRGANSIL
jgi:excinuclease ABC subunit B